MTKSFSLPSLININTYNLSYGSSVISFQEHAMNLNKQVVCIDLLSGFYQYIDLGSYELSFHSIPNSILEHDFKPPELSFSYDYHIKEALDQDGNVINDDNVKQIHSKLSSFTHYIDDNSQIEIIYWMLQLAKDNSIGYQYSKNKQHKEIECSIHITEKYIEILCQNAYGIDFPEFKKNIDKFLTNQSKKKLKHHF